MDIDLSPLESELGPIVEPHELMTIVEEEVHEYMRLYPAHAEALWHCVMLLRSDVLGILPHDAVARSHCRELLGRRVCGEDLDDPTNVNLIMGMSPFCAADTLGDTGEFLYALAWIRAGLPDAQGRAVACLKHHADIPPWHYNRVGRDIQRGLRTRREPLTWFNCRGDYDGQKVDCRYATDAD